MKLPGAQRLHDTVSALVYSLAQPQASAASLGPPYNDLTQFVLAQQARLPDYLRAPMQIATLGFDIVGLWRGKSFHTQPPELRARQVAAWKNSRLSVTRDLIRYYESLATLALHQRDARRPPARALPTPNCPPPTPSGGATELRAEIVVIGSGPGGAITAGLLAEAGRDVLLLEEGDHLPQDSTEPFSTAEMLQKYRNGGQTFALGKNKIAYVEGRCVGGGSEINSGLYHRTPPEILQHWRDDFQLEAAAEADLTPHFEQCERDVSICFPALNLAPASQRLQMGAARLGWKSMEVPRWLRPELNGPGKRQSMTETFIPRFLAANGRLAARTRALRIRRNGKGWLIEATRAPADTIRIAAEVVFLCAGAVHTPALLRRSGISHNIGNSLQVHPTVKLIAQFPEAVNAPDMGVPAHQVKEFSPRLSFGCSISSPGYLALGLLDHPGAAREIPGNWPHFAAYYAMITSESRGTVRLLPGFRDPLVRYQLTQPDRRHLAEGLKQLSRLLFAAGAVGVFPSFASGRALHGPADVERLPGELADGLSGLMSVHLFSSCPMGENRSRCATDSFGRVHGFDNLWINDASLLCTAPGVNPQGSIMAIARRNTLKYLGKL